MSKFKLQMGLNHCTNEEYHSDTEYVSSSVLKTILEDISKYYQNYIVSKPVNEYKDSYEFGTLAHTAILEPHLVDKNYAFFPEMRKQGAAFEAFKLANPGKIIIARPVKAKLDILLKAFKKNKKAAEMYKGGFAEQTICAEIEGIKVKARFDYISIEKQIIPDVKTTSRGSDIDEFKQTMDQFSYHISAALYFMVAESYYGLPFDFFFTVLSKATDTCDVYKTSEKTMNKGREAVLKALRKLKTARETNVWTEPTSNKSLDPTEYEILDV